MEAIRTLVKIAKSGKSESARVAASIALLDRGFGRPSQSVELNIGNMISKRIDEMSDAELVLLEERLVALGADGGAEPVQAELFAGRLN